MTGLVAETPEPNLPLLRKTMEYIEAHPEDWNQTTWARDDEQSSCGTTMCFAGTAVFLAGYSFYREGGPGLFGYSFCVSPDGTREFVSDAAARELGLTDEQKNEIFSSGLSDPARMRQHVEDVVGVEL